MALILCIWMLKPWIHKYNLQYLSDNECDSTLYHMLWENATGHYPRVEGSTKIINESSKENRYTVTLLIKHWNKFTEESKDKILDLMNFTKEDFNRILSKEQENISKEADTDIIFGWSSNGINKIYFDYDGSLVCYESKGKIKYYHFDSDNPDTITVTDASGSHIAKHYRNKNIKLKFNGYPVYWVAKGKDKVKSKTWYTRPIRAMILSDLADLF
jgi:hypothetical protein